MTGTLETHGTRPVCVAVRQTKQEADGDRNKLEFTVTTTHIAQQKRMMLTTWPGCRMAVHLQDI